MSTAPRRHFTVEEYLNFERGVDTKHEYHDGEIFAMGGASEAHVLIVTNITGELRSQLKRRPCKVYSTDMRLKVSPTGLYTYPDVMAVCGDARIEGDDLDTLLNPTIVVEVLSESTEDYDRATKFDHYRKIGSLTDYLLVAQDKPEIEQRTRRPDGTWSSTQAAGLTAAVRLHSIGCELRLSEVYDKVEF